MAKPPRRRRGAVASLGRVLGDAVKIIVIAVLIAVGFRTFLFEPFNIPSGSMIPTLQVGDLLFVAKYSYGYSRFSLPLAPPLFSGRIGFHSPQRGDVAVFRYPRDTTEDYIKRIVGLPGDHIQMKQGVLYVNGLAATRTPVGPYIADDHGRKIETERFTEAMPGGGRSYQIIKADDEGWANNTPEYVVPDNSFFAMGDNRDDSADSRYMAGVGFVPMQNLIGRAEFIVFSWDTDNWGIRWNRLFKSIQ